MKSKIINFSDILLQAHEQESDRDAILDVVVLPEINGIIQEAGLDPMKFFTDDASLRRFLELPITHKEEDDSFCSVYYDCCTVDSLYRAECRIEFDGDNVISETDLYKLNDYLGGNRAWLCFNGLDWVQGPGENYFEVDDVLHR